MLVDEPMALRDDPILSIISVMNSGVSNKRIQQGIYQVGHFGGSFFLPGYDQWPVSIEPSYGVCDSVEQLLKKMSELHSPEHEYVVTVTPIRRADQPREGGWRWHKWGEYIGDKKPHCEYLHDEPEIEQVYVFHIYEKK